MLHIGLIQIIKDYENMKKKYEDKNTKKEGTKKKWSFFLNDKKIEEILDNQLMIIN